MHRFVGRVALVTGASQGLGEAIAVRLAAEGAAVMVTARSIHRARVAAQQIASDGGTATPVACDVKDPHSVERAVAATMDAHGGLDIAVSNAGVNRDSLLHKMTNEEWSDVISTSLDGGFYVSRAVQRHMVERKYGRIVFIGSTAYAGNIGQVNYATAKAGLHGMAKTVALELGTFGITANVVVPGHIESPMTHALADRLGVDYEEIRADRIRVNAVKRVGTPEDVASAVAYVASEEAGYVTGQVLTVAGRSLG
jgi:3-oxoacyl-[acyl-carrier protein] reductase